MSSSSPPSFWIAARSSSLSVRSNCFFNQSSGTLPNSSPVTASTPLK